ncbi:MAG: hypothetical protein ACI9G1_005738, partial [Pirellulaceae bacterium]
ELLDILTTWQKQVSAPIPTDLNPQYDAEADALARRGKAGAQPKTGRKKKKK